MLLLLLFIAALLWASLLLLAFGPAGRFNPISPRVWWLLVGLALAQLWVADLHAARLQVILLLLPVGVAVGHAVRRRPLERLLGGVVALTLVSLLLLRRSVYSGCTGVSSSYERTLTMLFILLVLVAPLAVGHALRTLRGSD